MFRSVTFLCFGLSAALAQEPPVFTADSIRNAASLEPGITAGAITGPIAAVLSIRPRPRPRVTITGLHLTNGAGVLAADRYPLPTTLGGTSVKIDGVPASLWMRQQPGIFSLNGNPAILHAGSGQMVTPENPAAPDEVVSIRSKNGPDFGGHFPHTESALMA